MLERARRRRFSIARQAIGAEEVAGRPDSRSSADASGGLDAAATQGATKCVIDRTELECGLERETHSGQALVVHAPFSIRRCKQDLADLLLGQASCFVLIANHRRHQCRSRAAQSSRIFFFATVVSAFSR